MGGRIGGLKEILCQIDERATQGFLQGKTWVMKEGYDVMVKSENYSAFIDSKHKVPPSYSRAGKNARSLKRPLIA